ncbi:unnamed protein product [Prorocentrum cordatum]|uniref:Uncharacterized protein n=1 Tax=Prorocentrum cordatum TaxID=2364126 RepID=A0ABN9URU1_9DINO|nr:unnamed protein product [Polarella glacialis]
MGDSRRDAVIDSRRDAATAALVIDSQRDADLGALVSSARRVPKATEALAAAPHFAEKEGWQLCFTDGSCLSFSRAHSALGLLYTPLESEERRVKTLGLVFVEESSDAGSVRGWHVPPGWAYKSY